MMRYDIITVTYNSEKWLESYFQALEALQYDKKQLRLILVDNGSADGTVPACRAYQAVSTLGDVKVVQSGANIGFGAGNNLGAQQGNSPFLFLFNVDTEIFPDALSQMDAYIAAADEDVVAFEMRQSPVEMGKHHDPVTLETSWAAGAAVVVKRGAYEKIGGFDANIFMYADDIDLSWRLRAAGGRLQYCPRAAVTHHGWQKGDGGRFEYIHSAYAKLLLAYKYGHFGLIKAQNREYLRTLRSPRHFDGVRKDLLKLYLKHFTQIPKFLKFRRRQPELFAANVHDFRPGFAPERGQVVIQPITGEQPLVSVVVRTHKRKEVLRRTLSCLRNQIYTNFEVVVVEDGENTAEAMIKADFSDLNIRYHATGTSVGRGRVGNIGIEMAQGEFVSFLDDDDFYYPDFIDAHVARFMEHPEADVVLSGTTAAQCEVQSVDPYCYTYKDIELILFDHITLMDMCVKCRVPISGAMFRKKLYAQCGGMREDIGGDEDWAMWLKYITHGTRINPYNADINRAMSMCLYPANQEAAAKRMAAYEVFDKTMLYDENLRFTVHGSEIATWEQYVQADINHLRNIGRLQAFLAELRPLGEEELAYNPEGENTLTARQINHYYYWLVKKYAAQG